MLKTLIMDKLYFYRNIIEEKHRIVLEQGSLAKCKPSVDNSFLIEQKMKCDKMGTMPHST